MNSLSIERGIVLPDLGKETERKFCRLIAAEVGLFVPLSEVVASTLRPGFVDPEESEEEVLRRYGTPTRSLFRKSTGRLEEAGLCLVELQDLSVPRGSKGGVPGHSVAFALTRIEDFEIYGLESTNRENGLIVCGVGHERFDSLLDQKKIIIPLAPVVEVEKQQKKVEEAPANLTRIEDVRSENLKSFLVGLTREGSILARQYGQPISDLSREWPRLDRHSLAILILEAFGLMKTMGMVTRIEEVLKDGVVYTKTAGERGAVYLKKQKDDFSLVQVIAAFIFYSKYRELSDIKTSAGNVVKETRYNDARKNAIAEIGGKHILAEVLAVKLRENDNEEEDF